MLLKDALRSRVKALQLCGLTDSVNDLSKMLPNRSYHNLWLFAGIKTG